MLMNLPKCSCPYIIGYWIFCVIVHESPQGSGSATKGPDRQTATIFLLYSFA